MEKNQVLTPAERMAQQMKGIKDKNPSMVFSNNNIKLIPISSIVEVSLSNGYLMHNRITFDENKIKELAEEIKNFRESKKGVLESGLHQPITVRKNGEHYERIIGFRRCEAFKYLEIDDIPAHIIECTDEEAREIRSSENKQREDIHVYDEVVNTLEAIFISCKLEGIESAKTLINRYKTKAKLTDFEKSIVPKVEEIISREMSGDVKTISAFYRKLRVFNFNPIVLDAIGTKINFTQAEAIHKIQDEDKLKKIIEFIYDIKPNKEELSKKIDELMGLEGKNDGDKKIEDILLKVSKISSKSFLKKIESPENKEKVNQFLMDIENSLQKILELQ